MFAVLVKYGKTKKKKYIEKIDHLLEMEGIEYISTSRSKRCGGGAANAVRRENYSLNKLNVFIPSKVEVVQSQ